MNKMVVGVCPVTDMIYKPISWYGLKYEFIKATHETYFGKGAFNERYIVSHGLCERGDITKCWEGDPQCRSDLGVDDIARKD
jgi:hypothetical protein